MSGPASLTFARWWCLSGNLCRDALIVIWQVASQRGPAVPAVSPARVVKLVDTRDLKSLGG